jgi:luciferase-type oxidoreductase
MFRRGRLTLGVFLPITIDAASGRTDQGRRVRRAEALDFAALWCRDRAAPESQLERPGAVFDPWVHLSWLAGQTRTIALASGTPLRHALRLARTAASIDRLCEGRLVLGLAAGERPGELPAFGIDVALRATWFRERFEIARRALENGGLPPALSAHALTQGADALRVPDSRLPMLVTGNGGQSLRWIAERADGYITGPRGIDRQAAAVARWRSEVHAVAPGRFKPFAQSLCLELSDKPSMAPTPIHLGFKSGRHFLLRFLDSLGLIGVDHVILNLEQGPRETDEVLEEIGTEVLPALATSQARPGDGDAAADDSEPVDEPLLTNG